MNEVAKANERPLMITVLAIIAMAFGALTLFSGGRNLFDAAVIAEAGNTIGFVLWFNFLAGFAYIAAAVLLWMWKLCGVRLSAVIAGATLLVFLAMGIYVIQFDGLYNGKTVGAMMLRSSVWLLIAVLSRGYWQKFKATKTA
ncbi:MAG: hypothetical protein GQ535_07920 [Rhodobacteraceae bacterium]|nr:hypothetical protein [Paracoccaceae bacterium]